MSFLTYCVNMNIFEIPHPENLTPSVRIGQRRVVIILTKVEIVVFVRLAFISQFHQKVFPNQTIYLCPKLASEFNNIATLNAIFRFVYLLTRSAMARTKYTVRTRSENYANVPRLTNENGCRSCCYHVTPVCLHSWRG